MEPLVAGGQVVTDDDQVVKISIKPHGTNNQLVYHLNKTNLNEFIDDSGETIPHLAARHKDIEAVQKLIGLGCDIDAQNKFGMSPLLVATTASFKDISENVIEILCNADASIYATDREGNSPLRLVLDYSRFTATSIVKIFLKKLHSDCGNNHELIADKLIEVECPLARAICSNNVQVTQLLIERGMAVDTPHPRLGYTALHTAVGLKDLRNVKLLVERGADIVARDVAGVIPLAYYSSSSDGIEQPEIVRISTRRREFMMVDGAGGSMQIGSLLSDGTAQVIRVLLENNLDLCARDGRGSTPMHFLASNTNPNIVDELEGKEVDVYARDSRDATPLFYVTNSISMVELLFKKGVSADYPVIRSGGTLLTKALGTLAASDLNNRRYVEFLLRNDASVQVILNNGDTVFDCPCMNTPPQEYFLLMIIGHLVLREEVGQPISERIYRRIVAEEKFKKTLDSYRLMMKKLKDKKFTSSLSAYAVLVESVDQIVNHCVRCGSKMLLKLQRFDQRCQQSSTIYLLKVLHERLDLIIHRVSLVHEASGVLGKLIGLH